jgi:hypothetical protein
MGLSTSFSMLMLSFLLYTATATVSGAPYVAVYQMVPTRQRGKLMAFDRLLENFLSKLAANGRASPGWWSHLRRALLYFIRDSPHRIWPGTCKARLNDSSACCIAFVFFHTKV